MGGGWCVVSVLRCVMSVLSNGVLSVCCCVGFVNCMCVICLLIRFIVMVDVVLCFVMLVIVWFLLLYLFGRLCVWLVVC